MYTEEFLMKVLMLYAEGMPINQVALWLDSDPKEINALLDKLIPFL